MSISPISGAAGSAALQLLESLTSGKTNPSRLPPRRLIPTAPRTSPKSASFSPGWKLSRENSPR